MKKFIISLLFGSITVFGQTSVLLNDSHSQHSMPVSMLTNVTTPVVLRNNIVTGIYGWTVLNPNTRVCFVEFFDSATPVVLGITTPILTVPVPIAPSLNNFSVALPIQGFDPNNNQSHNLTVAAVTTPNGSTTCTLGIMGVVVLTSQ